MKNPKNDSHNRAYEIRTGFRELADTLEDSLKGLEEVIGMLSLNEIQEQYLFSLQSLEDVENQYFEYCKLLGSLHNDSNYDRIIKNLQILRDRYKREIDLSQESGGSLFF